MRKRSEPLGLGAPLAGWILIVGSVSLTAFLFSRVLELEVLSFAVGDGNAAAPGTIGVALAAIVVLGLCGVTLLAATLACALARSHRLSRRYAAMLYGRPLVVMLHVVYPAGVLFGLLVIGAIGARSAPVTLSLLGLWTAVGVGALLPYVSWLARDPEPELVADMVNTVNGLVARSFSKSDFSLAAKARVLERVRELGALGQKFVLAGDPHLAATVLDGFHDIVLDYLDRKDLSQRSWFVMDASYFPGLSPRTMESVTAAGTWFELSCLLEIRGVLRTGQASASSLPGDAATVVCRLGREALSRKDTEALRLTLSFLYDLLADELDLPHRAGTLTELLAELRRVAEDGLEVFPALVETHGRTLASLAILGLQSGRPAQAQRLMAELVDLIGHASVSELGPQLLAIYLRLGSVLHGESEQAGRLWEKGLLVLAATLRQAGADAEPMLRTVLGDLRKLDVPGLAESVILESAPLGWEGGGFGLDRGLRENVLRLAREMKSL